MALITAITHFSHLIAGCSNRGRAAINPGGRAATAEVDP
jgi:hypothetical protein